MLTSGNLAPFRLCAGTWAGLDGAVLSLLTYKWYRTGPFHIHNCKAVRTGPSGDSSTSPPRGHSPPRVPPLEARYQQCHCWSRQVANLNIVNMASSPCRSRLWSAPGWLMGQWPQPRYVNTSCIVRDSELVLLADTAYTLGPSSLLPRNGCQATC